LDIETVPLHEQYSELSAETQMLWEEKTRYQRKEEFSAEEFTNLLKSSNKFFSSPVNEVTLKVRC